VFILALIFVLAYYGSILVPKQSQAIALIALVLTILFVATGWPPLPAR